MSGFFWNLFFFAIALGILVVVHESGHFMAARWCGVKVLRFSIGFGRVIYRRTMRDGCEFAISALPLGGYVKMLGEGTGDAGAADPGSFRAKSLKQRALIIAAGPLANILLAFVFYTAANIMGIEQARPVIGDVSPDSIAARAELRPYDLITSIDGTEVKTWTDVMAGLIPLISQDSAALTVKGDLGREENRSAVLDLRSYAIHAQESPLTGLGLKPCYGRISDVIASVQENGPAAMAGILPGDRIVSVNGRETLGWFRAQDAIKATLSGTVTMVIERDGQLYSAEMEPEYRYNESSGRDEPFVGIAARVERLPELNVVIQYGPLEAAANAAGQTARMSLLVASAVYQLVTGAISADNLSGPVSIARGAGSSASIGLVFFISFMAAISVNLGILNLVPIPILDGGQLLFILYEGITRHEPSPMVQYVLSALGFAVLISVSMLAIVNDLRAL